MRDLGKILERGGILEGKGMGIRQCNQNKDALSLSEIVYMWEHKMVVQVLREGIELQVLSKYERDEIYY